MSKGPGRIERAIRELFDASPDRAFLTADLVKHCFSVADRIERKHEVSVLRAARKIVASDPDWCSWRREWGSIFFNHASLQSYALFEILRCEGRLHRPGSANYEWDYPDDYVSARRTRGRHWAPGASNANRAEGARRPPRRRRVQRNAGTRRNRPRRSKERQKGSEPSRHPLDVSRHCSCP
jgi:hypothetical protein